MLKNGRRRCRRLWGTVKEKNQNTLTAMNSTHGIRVCEDFRVSPLWTNPICLKILVDGSRFVTVI